MILIIPSLDNLPKLGEKKREKALNRIKRQLQRLGSQKPQLLQERQVYFERDARQLEYAKKLVKSAGLTTEVIQPINDDLAIANLSIDNTGIYVVGANRSLVRKMALAKTWRLSLEHNLLLLALSATTNGKYAISGVFACDKLPKGCPYPDAFGTEMRKRPPYYYTQSGVLPVRIQDGDIQVLLVTSSKNNHWGIAKGICEPGISKQASALKEAEEEAGITGECTESLGVIEFSKWGGSCTLEIYLMPKVQVLPRSQWQENHRNRHWCSIPLALMLLKHGPIKALLQDVDSANLLEIVKGYE